MLGPLEMLETLLVSIQLVLHSAGLLAASFLGTPQKPRQEPLNLHQHLGKDKELEGAVKDL